MLGIAYYFLFFAFGFLMVRFQFPKLSAVLRAYIGLSTGWLLLLWLPPLWAIGLSFGTHAHLAALLTMALLTLLCFLFRDRSAPKKLNAEDRKTLRGLLLTALPLTILGVYLEYTHTLRPGSDGAYYVGQSTYGDLQLHLSIASYAVGAKFPLQNSLLAGERLVYPYLSDTCASTLYLLGLPLNTAMVVSASIMLALVFSGFFLLCRRLCRVRGAAFLAFFLLFLNGGLGIFYVLDATVTNGSVTGLLDNLRTVMEGYYQTPTNQPDPHNLRWVNLICDMLIPQRGILGGWTLLLPALNLLLPRAVQNNEDLPDAHGFRSRLLPWLWLALFAGALPLVHTHSYLALVLCSAGFCLWGFFHAHKGGRLRFLQPWLLYAAVAAALSLPQLICFTFRQTGSSDHFIQLWFNWANNRNGDGQLVDSYLWFYLKNIGLPYLLILLALLQRIPKGELAAPEELARIRQNRGVACGAFTIYAIAEIIRFQPNVYDNNKLFYVWFLLCLPMAADYVLLLWQRLKGFAGRRVLAAIFLFLCFSASCLTIARECVSNYQVYDQSDRETASYVLENTPKDALFLTGTQHLNPISALAGRVIYCGPDLYLYYHGYSTYDRQLKVESFYENPAANLDFLKEEGISYIYVSSYERSSYNVDEDTLDTLFPVFYESSSGSRIWQVVWE